MRYSIPLFMLLVLSCNSKSDQSRTENDTIPPADTKITNPQVNAWDSVNGVVAKTDGKWHVVTDAETGWTADALEYFVYPQRKNDPNYPFLTYGDYNCDGQPDVAALVADSSGSVRLAFLFPDGTLGWWSEDMQGAALRNMKKQDFGAMKDEAEIRVSLKCDAVEAEWYEKATQVIFFNGKTFDNVWTAD